MLSHDETRCITDTSPGGGIDAAIVAAFDRPLIRSIREFIGVIIFQDQVVRHPDRFLNHPRAAAILPRAAQQEQLRATHRAKLAELAAAHAPSPVPTGDAPKPADHTF